MKTGSLKIGGKGVKAVTVPVQTPENLEDLSSLAKGNVEVITRWATRGHRIESQERSGARDLLKELRAKTPALSDEEITTEVAKLVADYDATQKAARGGPREKKPVVIKTSGGKLDMASFRAQLEAAGVKLQFEGEEGAAQG